MTTSSGILNEMSNEPDDIWGMRRGEKPPQFLVVLIGTKL